MAAGLAVPHGQTKDPGLAGRDTEAAEIGAFLAATAGAPSALVIVGDVGIGKTAVWKHAVQAASGTYRVLSCRPASAEAPLAFAALDDLFGEVLEEILPGLPAPRRRALEAALHGSPAEPIHDQPGRDVQPGPNRRRTRKPGPDGRPGRRPRRTRKPGPDGRRGRGRRGEPAGRGGTVGYAGGRR